MEDVRVPRHGLLFLVFANHPPLRIEIHPLARVHTARTFPRNPNRPLSFQGLLRARMVGPLRSVCADPDDRSFRLAFDGGTLHVHMFAGGGIWWVEAGRAIAAIDGPCPPDLPSAGPPPREPQRPRFHPEGGEGWLAAGERWFDARAREDAANRRLREVVAELRRREAREGRLCANLDRDLAAVGSARKLRADADALSAVLHLVPRGAASAEVPDHASGGTRRVTLDPARPAREHLTRWYERARRLERAAEPLLERLLKAQDRRAELLGRLQAVLEDPSQVEPIASAERIRAAQQDVVDRPVARVPWLTWRGPHGAQVWIGRSGEANRRLVFRHARGRDLWLHVRDCPGAHAVVPHAAARSSAVVDAAIQLLLRAGRLDAGQAAEVQLARVADVRPRRDGPAGAVWVQNERVRQVRATAEVPAGWWLDDGSSSS